jgi:hypothetical protein
VPAQQLSQMCSDVMSLYPTSGQSGLTRIGAPRRLSAGNICRLP